MLSALDESNEDASIGVMMLIDLAVESVLWISAECGDSDAATGETSSKVKFVVGFRTIKPTTMNYYLNSKRYFSLGFHVDEFSYYVRLMCVPITFQCNIKLKQKNG